MSRLKAANNVATTLASGINDSVTSLTVASATGFPDAPFRITIHTGNPADGEIIEVGGKSGTTFSSLLRGQESTAAASWSEGATIEMLGTAGMYEELLASIEEDTSPKLGGNLDAADYIVGKPVIKDYAEAVKAHGTTGGSITLDLEDGNIHTITLDEATTFTFSNPPASGKAGSLTLILTQPDIPVSITWPSSVKWDEDKIPDTSKGFFNFVFIFTTLDGGNEWKGWVSRRYISRNDVYAGTEDGYVRKLKPSTGSIIWTSADLENVVYSVATDTDGYVYVGLIGDACGYVKKLNPSTGSIIWTSADLENAVYSVATNYYAGWGV